MAKSKPKTNHPTKHLSDPSTVKVKKTSLIGLIVTVVVLVALIAGAIGGAAVYFFANQTKMPDWADTYLTHIKTVRHQRKDNTSSSGESKDKDNDESFWADQSANPQVGFYESSNNPMMLVNYTSVENNLSYNSVAVYSIQNEEIYLLNYENTEFYYVYDLNSETYNYYLKSENPDQDENTYIDIDDYFENPDADSSKYQTTCSTDESAKDFCEDTFVEEPIEIPSFKYSDNMSDRELSSAIANASEQTVTEEKIQEQTTDKLQNSATIAQERLKKKSETPEYFMVGDQQIKYGKYETVDYEGVSTGAVALILNPDNTATYTISDYNPTTMESAQRQVTTKFEVRPVRNGDVPSTDITCNDANGGPCYLNTFNGQTALIISPDGSYYTSPRTFLVTHEASSDPSKKGGALPHNCDFEPAMGVMYFCYRFLSQ